MQNIEFETGNPASVGEGAQKASRIHGGDIYEAARRYGVAEKKIIDFSSNVNPLGPSSSALRAAKKSLALVERYPDPAMSALRRAIARYFGIKPGHVACGNGSNALIHLIPRVFRPKKVLIAEPTFTEYAAAVESAGGEVVALRLRERDGFRVDPLEIAFALKGVDMAFLCNPNNPTGLLIPKAEMLEIAQYAVQNNVRLVVDEAFMDYIDGSSILKEAVQSSHLICLRAFTKFFGMPGLRVGYAVASEAVIEFLRSGQEPWTVNIPAEQAAIVALNDWRYIKKTRKTVEKERTRFLSDLRIIPGIEAFASAANFIFVKVTASDAPLLIEKLGRRGLLVRGCSSFPGLDNRFIRLAVRKRSENARLVQALRELLAG